jgi:hypothetical protein
MELKRKRWLQRKERDTRLQIIAQAQPTEHAWKEAGGGGRRQHHDEPTRRDEQEAWSS